MASGWPNRSVHSRAGGALPIGVLHLLRNPPTVFATGLMTLVSAKVYCSAKVIAESWQRRSFGISWNVMESILYYRSDRTGVPKRWQFFVDLYPHSLLYATDGGLQTKRVLGPCTV